LGSVRRDRLVVLLLVAVTFTVYSQVGQHEFVSFDDLEYIYQNPHLEKGLTPEGVRWALTTTYVGNWHPLTWLSLLLDYELYGLKAAGYHLTNLLLHVASTTFLFLALRCLTGALWRSAAVAALFALHPLHVESVAWASERKDVLSGLFFMLTLWAYARYATRSPSLWRYLGVLVCLILGLSAKSMLVTTPFVLILLDFWPLGRLGTPGSNRRLDRARVRSCIVEKLPLLLPVLGSSWLALLAQRHSGAIVGDLPLHLKVGNALVAYMGYLGKAVWPMGLSVFYPHSGASLSLPLVVCAALALLAISVLVLRVAVRRPYLAVGWFWYVGMLVPVIGIVQIGHQAMADRYTYLPLIGIFLMGVWGAAELCEKWNRSKAWLTPAVVGVLGALTVLTWAQVGTWKSSIALFEHAVRVTERNAVAHLNLGSALMKAGDSDRAIPHLTKALDIDPRFFPAHQNLEVIYARQGNREAALRHRAAALWIILEDEAAYGFSRHAQRGPEATASSREGSEAAAAHYGLGVDLATQGRIDEAVPHFEAALRLRPEWIEARLALGTALLIHQRRGEAMRQYLEALRLRPGDKSTRYRLAIALAQEDRIEEAIDHLSAVLHENPGHPAALWLIHILRGKQPVS
jgi:Flp pilus assembly protein TadD